jgi:transcriptional regulator with XRE-family HTH domain
MNDADIERIANRARELREENGLSVPEAARGIRCVRDTVYKIERGVIQASLRNLWAMAELYQVYPVDFLTFPGKKDDRYDLIEMTRHATEDQLKAMKAACQAILTSRKAKARKG